MIRCSATSHAPDATTSATGMPSPSHLGLVRDRGFNGVLGRRDLFALSHEVEGYQCESSVHARLVKSDTSSPGIKVTFSNDLAPINLTRTKSESPISPVHAQDTSSFVCPQRGKPP